MPQALKTLNGTHGHAHLGSLSKESGQVSITLMLTQFADQTQDYTSLRQMTLVKLSYSNSHAQLRKLHTNPTWDTVAM